MTDGPAKTRLQKVNKAGGISEDPQVEAEL
jgi:hypothetical protein